MEVEIKIPNHTSVTADDTGVTIERKGPIMLTDGAPTGNKQFGNFSKGLGILFRNGKNKEMANLYEFIDKKIKEAHDKKDRPVNNIRSADELAKFKKLLDDGTITQEEFNAKKKQLLGL